MFREFIIISCALYISVYSKTLPDYLKKCSLQDPKFSQCALKSAREAIPRILLGHKAYKIPNLKPLHIPFIELNAGANLTLNIKDLIVTGIDTVDLKELDFDIVNGNLKFKIHLKELDLRGTYNVSGNILVFPIYGTGPGHVNFAEPKLSISVNIDFEPKNGRNVAKVSNEVVTATYSNVFFELENLFGGDKRLGPHMNKFLNENWKEVVGEFGQLVTTTISSVYHGILTGYFENLTLNDIVLK